MLINSILKHIQNENSIFIWLYYYQQVMFWDDKKAGKTGPVQLVKNWID